MSDDVRVVTSKEAVQTRKVSIDCHRHLLDPQPNVVPHLCSDQTSYTIWLGGTPRGLSTMKQRK